MAVALAALNLDPEIPGCKIKLIRLMVFMFSHSSSFTDGQNTQGEPSQRLAPCGPVALVRSPCKASFGCARVVLRRKNPTKAGVGMPRKFVNRRDGGLILRNCSGVRQEAPG